MLGNCDKGDIGQLPNHRDRMPVPVRTRACSQLSQPDEGTRQMDERLKGRCQFVVACGDTPEALEASEEAFDQVAVSVEMAIEAALGKSIGTRRNDGLCAGGLDLRNEMIGVVALVRDDGVRREVLDGLGRTVDAGNLTGQENHPQRIAQGIHRDMQFGR